MVNTDIAHKAHLGMRLEQTGTFCMLFSIFFNLLTFNALAGGLLVVLSLLYMYVGASFGNSAAVQKITLLKAELLNKEAELSIFRGVKNE